MEITYGLRKGEYDRITLAKSNFQDNNYRIIMQNNGQYLLVFPKNRKQVVNTPSINSRWASYPSYFGKQMA